ncbi:MAG: FecR domain-containing protein [Phycisphaerales bacterium]|nr:MAG: FecR domain-containing protein [Phycisphaerales bacterium]
MKRAEDKDWLDEALTEAIGSKRSTTDFAKWKQTHAEAVEQLTSRAHSRSRPDAGPPRIRKIKMNSLAVKLAAAAAIAIAGIIGIHQLAGPDSTQAPQPAQILTGPLTSTLADGSVVALANGAQIRPNAGERGFEHLAGQVNVTVTKGKGEFIVTTAYGDVKALGTEFTINLVDGIAANTQEKVQLLAVEVKEGSVEVSNAKGSRTLKALQELVVEKEQAPYDVSQDESLPQRLRERIQSMSNAMKAADPRAWLANSNIDHLYKLVKGTVDYDPELFGGSEADVERLRQAFSDVESLEQLAERLLSGINLRESSDVYVRSVELNDDGDHAVAECVSTEAGGRIFGHSPKWHYFDNDWWQVDD